MHANRLICLIAFGFLVQCLAKPVSEESSKEVVATTDGTHSTTSHDGKSYEEDSKNASAELSEKHDVKESVETDKKHQDSSTSHGDIKGHVTAKHEIKTKPTVAPQTNHVSDEAAEATE